MSSLTQFFGGSGSGLAGGGFANAIMSNPIDPLAPDAVGMHVTPETTGTTYTNYTVELCSPGYNDLEFVSSICFTGPQTGTNTTANTVIVGYGKITNLAVTTICRQTTLNLTLRNTNGGDQNTGNLTEIDGFVFMSNQNGTAQNQIVGVDLTGLSVIDNIYMSFGNGTSQSSRKFVLTFANCALNQASVDRILIACADSVTRNNYTSSSGQASNIDLRRGSNAAPSSAANAAIATLTSAAIVVNTN